MLTEVPSLYPTEEEFANPIEYLASPEVASLGTRYGLLKIVPPSGFKPPLSINEHKFRFTPRLQKLKELNLLNRCRMFFHKQLKNYNVMNRIKVPNEEYAVVCGKKIHYYDFFIECVKFYKDSAKDLPNLSSSIMLNDTKLWNYLVSKFKLQRTLLIDFYEQMLMPYFNFLSLKPEFTTTLVQEQYPTSILQDNLDSDSDSDLEDSSCLICKKNSDPANTLLCDSCNKPYHTYCLSPPLSKIPKDSWCCVNCVIGNGYYGFKDSPIEYSLRDFKDLNDDFDKDFFPQGKPHDVDTLEKQFWELVDNTDNDVKINYGADIHNLRRGEVSGFPTKDYIPLNYRSGPWRKEYNSYVTHPMNLNNLPFEKHSLLNYLDVDISGMTIPWIYVGNTFSTFCWHVEDQYTLSANYQHLGATKKWYGIPAHCAEKFESYMKSLAPDLFAKQPDILHQLITLVSPFKLREAGIECFTANQEPDEYIVTYPRVYHAGFNCGYNLNEAVNFTMTSWLDFGVLASRDYKKNATKSSLFDIWELMLTVLENFLNVEDEELSNVDLKLIKQCLHYLKPKLTDEYGVQCTILDSLDIKPQKYVKLDTKYGYEMTEQEKKEHEDGISCEECKGFCTFAFVRHYEPIETISSYLPTPQSSPSTTEDMRRSKRIKVKTDSESYRISVYCLEDYLKVKPNAARDQFFIMNELDQAKGLIQRVEAKLATL
jgi:histone demethylase JARID1